MLRFIAVVIIFLFLPAGVYAESNVQFNPQLTQKDALNVMREVSTLSMHTVVAGASHKSMILGAEFGILGSRAVNPAEGIVKENKGHLNTWEAYALVSLPFGMTLEGNWAPSVKVKKFSRSKTSFAVKWNFSEVMPIIPFNFSTKLFYSNGSDELKSKKIDIKSESAGLQFLASWDFFLIEPYTSVGYVITNSKFSGEIDESKVTFLDEKFSSLQWTAGAELVLLVYSVGLEAQKTHGTTRYIAKFGFSF